MASNKNLDNSLKIIAKSSLIVFITLLLSKFFTFLYKIIIARSYGTEGPLVYGLFSLSFMVVSWIVLFSSLGLPTGILRFIPMFRSKNENKKSSYVVKHYSKLLFWIGIICGVLLFIFSDFIAINYFHNPDLSTFLKIFSISIPFLVLIDFFTSVMLSYERIVANSMVYNVLANLIKPLILVILIFLGFKSLSVALSFTLGTLITFFVAFLYCKKRMKELFLPYKIDKTEKSEINKDIFTYSWPIIITTIFGGFFITIDTLFIGFFKPLSNVGMYDAAVSIATLLTISPMIFIKLFFPIIVKEYSKNNIPLIGELSKQVNKWIFIINFPIFILMILFPGAILNILFGNGFLEASNCLRVLLIGNLLVSLFQVPANLISMTGRSKVLLYDTIIVAIINVTFDLILIPMPKILGIDNSNGLVGAAIASLIYIITYFILFSYQARKYTTIIPLRKKIIRIILVTIIPIIIIFYLRSIFEMNIYLIILTCVIFLGVYAALLFFTGCLDKNDTMILKSIKEKFFSIKKSDNEDD